jgi:(1->4)-alpha-D-glucan 1-alpha-D-glucosylmutase
MREENGRCHQGVIEFNFADALDQTLLDGKQLLRFELKLPGIDQPGYHHFRLFIPGAEVMQSTIIIAPQTCYMPPGVDEGKKIWGVSLQLYALRSRRNWGIGDFTDLQAVVDRLAPLGVEVIGLNPLHALFPHLPENASPYSPSSRDFLNPIYLDIEAIDEYTDNETLAQEVSADGFQQRLRALLALDLIDYSGVWAAKLPLLQALYRSFRQAHQAGASERIEAFRQFNNEGGEDLYKFALFEALQAWFHRQDSSMDSWQQWPDAYRDPDSQVVANWAVQHADEIEFHQYLQWNTAAQLSAIQENCKARGLCLGIYRDLAVANASSSAQCWSEPSLYALDMGVGAPPDDFNLSGQNWALPAPLPQALRERAYRPFIHTLRANMRAAGALRIDHVMGLMRLFWVPPNCSPERGSYVAYPFDDLLGIVALESQRNRCLIIGEDLGTVPDEVRHALYANRIFSYRIFRFEKDWERGSMKAPADYPRHALCTAGSHDLPTLCGFWRGTDLKLLEQLDLYPSNDVKQQQQQLRQRDRHEIIAALARENLVAELDSAYTDASADFGNALALAIQRYLARSKSAVMMVQLEDLFLQEEQVNLPGTVNEYPNWRRKMRQYLEDWPENGELERFAGAINRERVGT